jgi:ribosomal-protein-alanine N-acetyltransferase
MIGLAVRLAEYRDIPAITAIVKSNRTAPHWTGAQFRDMLESHSDGETLCKMLTVGEHAGQIAGFAAASALCTLFPVEADLEILAVAPALQRLGIGRALLQATFDWAAAQKAGILRLEVRASNERALRMYREAGFRSTGRRLGYYADPAEDAVVMERTLANCAGGLPPRFLA